jgi:hypothetical protein
VNCDGVFDILTRGPFPSGCATDEAVEAHLVHCRECQRLAEALRPAVALFQESIGADEGRDVPGYWGETCFDEHRLEPDWNPVAQTGVASWKRATVGLRRRFVASGWPLVAAALAGVALAVGLRDDGSRTPDRAAVSAGPPAASISSATFVHPLAECSRMLLAKLQGETPAQRLALAHGACCSDCHSAQRSEELHLEKRVASLVAQNCGQCHN